MDNLLFLFLSYNLTGYIQPKVFTSCIVPIINTILKQEHILIATCIQNSGPYSYLTIKSYYQVEAFFNSQLSLTTEYLNRRLILHQQGI